MLEFSFNFNLASARTTISKCACNVYLIRLHSRINIVIPIFSTLREKALALLSPQNMLTYNCIALYIAKSIIVVYRVALAAKIDSVLAKKCVAYRLIRSVLDF